MSAGIVAISQALGKRAARPVAGAPRRFGDSRVVIAVWVGDRLAGPLEPALADRLGPLKLVVERRVVELRETRVRAGMGPDFPPTLCERAELVPGHWHELRLELGAPVVDAGPRHRPLGVREISRDENGCRPAEACEDRLRQPDHRSEGVVERDGDRPAARRSRDGFGERYAAIAAALEELELPGKTPGSGRERRVPAVAESVVAED